MNVRLDDGTVRCTDHMDASNHQGQTADPCLYCTGGDLAADDQAWLDAQSTGVGLDKTSEFAPWETETLVRPNALPFYPLYTHRDGLRRNDLITLASTLFIISLHGGTAHQAPMPGTVGTDGKIVPVNF